MKRTAGVLSVVLGIVVFFYVSLFAFGELFTEVVVLRTFDSEGAAYDTRVMVVEIADTPWVRGRAYRGWFRRIEADPNAELYRGDAWQPVKALISRDPADAAEFERILVERHGSTYQLLDFIARMSSNEIPVRLDPRVPARR